MTTPASEPRPDPVPEVSATPDPATTRVALSIAQRLDEKQATDIAILDVSGPLVIADYFVIATVQSPRQAIALARELDMEAKSRRHKPRRNAGGLDGEGSNWVLLDYDDIVVHLFQPEARSYYALETLWADVPRVPFTAAVRTEPVATEIRQPTLEGFGAFLPAGSADDNAPESTPGTDDPR
ncbi:MAG: ribosome silencing factor [Planctomycetes bacterium]|nr:ribosome silencing factor [Planctomycetota bacterium]